MLVEGVLALLAVATVMILPARPDRTPVAVFAGGVEIALAIRLRTVFTVLIWLTHKPYVPW